MEGQDPRCCGRIWVIGKRVAEAISQQDDLELAGVSGTGTDWRLRMATHKGSATWREDTPNEEA